MPNQFNGQRPIDKISQENYSWWKKSFVFIKKTEIKTWQAIFIIAFAAGAITAVIWTVNNNLQSVSNARTKNQTGNLYVASNPTAANLYVDNVLKGTTPTTATGLSVGNHAVKVTKSGYNDYAATTYIYAGQTASLNIALTLIQTPTFSEWPTKTTSLMAKLSSGANVAAIFSLGQGKIEIDCATKVTDGYNNLRVFICPTVGSNQVCQPEAGGTAVTVRVFDTLAVKALKVCGGDAPYVVYR